jgi:hypothetical protein
MLKYLYPQIKRIDLFRILEWTVIGGLLAAVYGTIHDQLTYTISPEYFTKLKFRQFHYADFQLGERIFVATIGILATWWAGMFLGWVLGRRFVPNQPPEIAKRNILKGLLTVFGTCLLFATIGFSYGSFRQSAVLHDWSTILSSYNVIDGLAFVQVAYIHNGSYLGALAGLFFSVLFIRRHPA